jgi:hypothetical protein
MNTTTEYPYPHVEPCWICGATEYTTEGMHGHYYAVCGVCGLPWAGDTRGERHGNRGRDCAIRNAEKRQGSPDETRIADALEALAKRRPNPQVIVLPVANGPLTKENLERAAEELRRVFERAMGGEGDGQ